MNALILLFALVAVLAVLGSLAMAFGAETRDGFAGDVAPTGLR
jgi:hypothetical protein